MVDLSHNELVAMMKDIAAIKADSERAHEERKAVQGDLREVKGTLAEVKVTLVRVSELSEGLTMVRTDLHERFNKVHLMYGGLEQTTKYQRIDINELKAWRSTVTTARTAYQVWISWLTALFSSAGTVLFIELVKWAFHTR